MSTDDVRRADGEAVLVVADGDVAPRSVLDATWPGWDHGVGFVIAADGGAAKAEACLGRRPDLVVGDADSLAPELLARYRADGTPVRIVPTAKDESDFELALLAALERRPRSVTVVGALGGPRVDHEIAALALLAHPALAATPLTYVDARARVRLLRGPGRLELPGAVGLLVSLLPLGGPATGVTTHGLHYPLRAEPLPLGPARGLSNVREHPQAAVELERGLLLVVESSPEVHP